MELVVRKYSTNQAPQNYSLQIYCDGAWKQEEEWAGIDWDIQWQGRTRLAAGVFRFGLNQLFRLRPWLCTMHSLGLSLKGSTLPMFRGIGVVEDVVEIVAVIEEVFPQRDEGKIKVGEEKECDFGFWVCDLKLLMFQLKDDSKQMWLIFDELFGVGVNVDGPTGRLGGGEAEEIFLSSSVFSRQMG
ncbi:hypothetical protein L1049_014754 [Liquidambar formosana]|uniref:Uncharacterized protein n=1 Tax=Liquidambar formosana TaxID=63359 RepID=A0AAP0X601_LIQFO